MILGNSGTMSAVSILMASLKRSASPSPSVLLRGGYLSVRVNVAVNVHNTIVHDTTKAVIPVWEYSFAHL